ncbi:chromosome segregation protein SMC [Leptolyngbyaceae cyanobacterium CCMR0082]|uniref:Chromosome segregation protein SMC n=2 Tax=Adonisia turfae TaxID=2950184 RepID=A0A6M0SGS9_9CYAN|nr:AAA family ATPase [Adonisia turfae]MDV3353354.1 AAA family ATPase [Leptothoe sp. LEGE 181152]NEZ56115.1 chromosome segregation protein SMC [Adonisia turfae CCMR0081]NEZ67183.1 chromosome segregation protein SMC [Adonisia turfae CCMR0082]
MLRSLRIENFRCFRRFELQQLGKLNLLVGTNNSGKTSILEAVQLLYSQSNLESLREVMIGRGEYIFSDERGGNRELDVRHLFHNHEIDVGSKFSILSNTHSNEEGVTVSVENSGQMSLFEDLRELVLVIEWLGQENESIKLPLSSREGLPLDYIRRVRKDLKKLGSRTQFITSSSLTSEKMVELFDQVVLTPEEELVTEVLQIIEPSINRIASVGSEKYRYPGDSRSGFVVRLTNEDQRIPIGSMGDGIWRMLGLTLAIVNARNGVLLVDEIDTGFHFSAMSDMWKLIWKTAKRLNVQVFATTHNSDCWTSLAAMANSENVIEEGITIQRIEKDKPKSIVFTERQVVIAAERGIEVR